MKPPALMSAAFLCLFTAIVAAQETSGDFLDGAAIEALLNDVSVTSADPADPWSQMFSAGGETVYTNAAGERSKGAWGVRGDRYCSLWPPSNDWECYRVRTEMAGGEVLVIWVTNSGFETTGRITDN